MGTTESRYFSGIPARNSLDAEDPRGTLRASPEIWRPVDARGVVVAPATAPAPAGRQRRRDGSAGAILRDARGSRSPCWHQGMATAVTVIPLGYRAWQAEHRVSRRAAGAHEGCGVHFGASRA